MDNKRMQMSDILLVGIDMSLEDDAVLTVARPDGIKIDVLNHLEGMPAIELYQRLTNKYYVKENNHE